MKKYAFPFRHLSADKINPRSESDGMKLRDYFAANALTGLMARRWGDEISAEELFTIWAKSSYGIADAMMKIRDSE